MIFHHIKNNVVNTLNNEWNAGRFDETFEIATLHHQTMMTELTMKRKVSRI